MLLHQLCAILVAGAHVFAAGLVAVVAKVSHLSHRENCYADAELVHLLQGLLRTPGTSTPDVAKARRLMMMVHIDGAAAHVQLVDLGLGKDRSVSQNR